MSRVSQVAHAVTNPIGAVVGMGEARMAQQQTINNKFANGNVVGALGDIVFNAVDAVSMGGLSNSANAVNALANDIAGDGNGFASGRILGESAADLGTAAVTGKMSQTVGGAVREAGAIGSTNIYI